MIKPLSTLTKEQLKDRIRGCLFGNAVGDAYGLATEFMSKGHARERYGNGPIEFGSDAGYPVYIDFHRSKWSRNDFTDDTDQMLLILQTLQQTQDGRLHAPLFAKRLKEWSIIGFPEMQTPPRGIGYTVGSTLSHPEFRYNPHKAAFDVWNARGRNLAANGAVMRTSVLGVESFWDEARVVENALAAAKVTHADPRSIVSALIASVLISRLLRGGGQSADEDASRTWNPKLEQESYKLELLEYLRRGSDMKDELVASCFPKNLDDLKLGDAAGMGYTFKCIGIGYYAATKREDPAPTSDAYKGPAGLFRGVMEQVTLEAGDADTNGAVVGSLLGARLGVKEGIPNSWWTELKHFEWFSSTVDEYADRVIAMYEEQEQRRL
ncbi:ADP-ribosylation/Crystallin J1 [Dissophora ornata]|nr:ADP-ribosylation/Crystallin J1 [Dissophora ornata]